MTQRHDGRHVHRDGRQRRNPEPDRYDIASVQKVGDNLWQFNTKMECCGVEGKGVIPIVVPMRFFGDTPMIEMTDTSLPGIGTFTVRVFFYGDRYSGTWQHGKVGGHMSWQNRKGYPADKIMGNANWGFVDWGLGLIEDC